jgi:2-polyprenyl-3-methyl-5-hydroxy-6-metoxy-1,4-benzoquinol methylase
LKSPQPTLLLEGSMLVQGIITEYVKCDLCGSEDQTPLYAKTDPVTGLEFSLVQCKCGMAFVNPMPTKDSISALYPDDYQKDKDVDIANFRRLLDFLPSRPNGNLLDIGCGRGDFVKLSAEAGWDAEGVDLIDWNSPHRIRVRVGNFLTMDLPHGHYDAVTAWAFLEHVRQPSLYFQRVSQLIKDNGRFIFIIPNVGAPGMRHSSAEDIPRHLWLFTPGAVRGYLERYSMEVERVLHTDQIYTAYPFGLLWYALAALSAGDPGKMKYLNRSVGLLRNRRFRGNIRPWIGEVLKSVSPLHLAVDLLDIALAVTVGKLSKLMGNYGIILVSAKKKAILKEDC